jgi:hypothetical protein
VPVDPTWANTTGSIDYFHSLDLNHITFAIHGHDPVKPYPAGLYKLPQTDKPDINIKVGDQKPENKIGFSGLIKAPLGSLFGLPGTAILTLSNQGNHTWYQEPFNLKVTNGKLISEAEIITSNVLPFTSQKYKIKLQPATAFQSKSMQLIVNHQEDSKTYDLQPIPSGFNQSAIAIAMALGALVIITAVIARSLLVPRRKR